MRANIPPGSAARSQQRVQFVDQAGEAAIDQPLGLLGVHELGERRETDQVGEQDGDDAPLGHVFVLADKHYKWRLFTFSNLFLYWSPAVWGPKLVLIPWDFIRGRYNSSSAGGPIRVFNCKGFRRFGERVADLVLPVAAAG